MSPIVVGDVPYVELDYDSDDVYQMDRSFCLMMAVDRVMDYWMQQRLLVGACVMYRAAA